MPVQGTPISQTHYGTRAGVEAQFGPINADANADIDNAGVLADIAARFEAALTAADNRVAARAAMLHAPIPATGTAMYSELVNFANIYAGVWLYEGRGEPDGQGEPFDQWLSDAEDGLTAALLANRGLLGVTGTWDAAPVAIASGTNVAAADRLAPWPYWGTWWPWG